MFVRRFLQAFGLIAVFLLLSFIYLRHLDNIGKLPAESIEYSASDSLIRTLEKDQTDSGSCKAITSRAGNDSSNSSGKVQIYGPNIPLVKVDDDLLKLVDSSHIFLVHDGRLYAADQAAIDYEYRLVKGSIKDGLITGSLIHKEDSHFARVIKKEISIVSNQLIEQGYVTRSSMELLERKSQEYYLRCPNLSKNEQLGITEYFWAAEGRSVLHHWAHFYEGAVFSSKMKAQYGVVIPIIAQFISSNLPHDGPTQYISVVWILFYLSALLYSILLFLIFKKYPITVITFLLIKIVLFINLREFIIFLAPGAHWFRELNFLIIYFISNYFIFIEKDFKYYRILFLFLLFIFTLLLDPMSGAFAWTAVFLSYIVNIYKKRSIEITKKNALIAATIVLTLVITVISYSSNAYYFLSMINNNIISSDLSNHAIRYLILNTLTLIIILTLYIKNKLNYKYIYFAFLGNISIIYYLMTPDWVHYYKYLEYVLPFYMCIFIILKNFVSENAFKFFTMKTNFADKIDVRSLEFLKILILLVIFLIIFFNLMKFNSINKESPITTMFGSDNNIFFKTDDFIINNKKISANISSDLAGHLGAYPLENNQNFIVSNFDKYILFLYDVKNNFGFIDLRTQLVSDMEMDKIISAIKNNGGTFVVDHKNLQINLGFGPKISGDRKLIEGDGKYFLGPYNFAKTQLRMAKISEYIYQHCNKNDQQSNTQWSVFSCPIAGRGFSK
ncbi:hypothetical protein [Polynucleobacter sp.]|uniref:hypothetical protein n=1 Tax=Polynucleobacter sp. TaxID=2029855 RepID=UPI0027366670|nr:hypothetical protein [Polynucleobacter sp.]MDP3122724.1 hypothetical protein [Polynucleobacter sp.]